MDKRDLAAMLIIIVLMLTPRIIVAPYTSGSDIPQFAGFADTFLRHGLCFYKYADTEHASGENWPYPWPYVYGPALILLLAPLRSLFSSPVTHYWDQSSYHVYVSMDWIIATKTLFILFDVLSATMIYVVIRSLGYSRRASALLTSLYAFNPMTIYISSIYGMFDQIPLFFYLVGIYLLYIRGNTARSRFIGSFLSGLSIAIKHTFLFPIGFLLYDLMIKGDKWGKKLLLISGLITGALILFVPFELACPSSTSTFIYTVLSSSRPGYTLPICYSFNGLSSLATYIHEHVDKDMMHLIENWWIPAVILIVTSLIAYHGYKDPIVYSSLTYLVFVTTYWRVNHQYLVPAVALSIILFAKLRRYRRCRFLASLYIVLIGFWPIMFPTSWWAHAHIKEPNTDIWKLLDKFSLMVFDEELYLFYSLALTLIGYLLILEVLIIGLTRIRYRAAIGKLCIPAKSLYHKLSSRVFPRRFIIIPLNMDESSPKSSGLIHTSFTVSIISHGNTTQFRVSL